MLPKHKMDPKGKTVERIGTLITLAIILIITIAMFVVLKLWLTDISKWFILIPIGIGLIIGIYSLIIQPYYMYRNFRYDITNDEVNIKSGIFMIEESTIPMGRIQNVDLYEGFFMRKFNLASISLSTAGGNSGLKYLKVDIANEIKRSIQNRIDDNKDEYENEGENV